MREIKFRAWENNKMYYQVRCGGMFDGIPTAPTVWIDERGDWANLTGQPYTKVMQYTGLKDRNGKEIYEGDIVKCRDGNTSRMVPSEVRFVDGCFCTKNGSKYDHKLGKRVYHWIPLKSYVEVIGNIYEGGE